MRRASRAVTAALAVAGVGYALHEVIVGSAYSLRVLSLAGTMAIAALGYQFIFGQAGALSLCQGTFMGMGAYVAGLLNVRYGVGFDAALPASIGAACVLAGIAAVPVLRLRSHYFALATLILGQIALLVATSWESATGGANGVGGISGLSIAGFAVASGRATLALVWAFVAVGAALSWCIMRGRRGDAFALLRANEAAARCVGIDADRARVVAFLLSAAYAGVAGALQAHIVRVVSPDALGFPVMITLLTIAVVGGRRRIAGAVAGAVLIVELPEWFRFLRDDYLLAYGIVLLIVGVTLPDGLIDAAESFFSAGETDAPIGVRGTLAPRARRDAASDTILLLEVTHLNRRFGGVRALKNVSLTLGGGTITGLIGPNGSGKTTLINAISGISPADSGRILFRGRDISRQRAHRIARAGIARTFQATALVDAMTALDNVALADTIPGDARDGAMTLLAALGADRDAATLASALPSASRRRVEIARALATDPRLLLLDEPAAGMNEAEQADLAGRLRAIAARGVALLIAEHNIGFLTGLADRLVCLDDGIIIADGEPDDVRADPAVRDAYLGGSRR